jgi:hypothetical protein
MGRALPCLCIIEAHGLPQGCRDGLPGFDHAWCAGLVQADLGTSGVVGPCGDCQPLLQGPDKRRVGVRGHHPWLVLPRCEGVFLRVVRPPSARLGSTMSRSTSWSAPHVRGHRTRPSGGALQAIASRCASWTPSRVRYGRPVGRVRAKAASRPCSPQGWRTRWTGAALGSTASALSASVQRRPPASTSAFRRLRAWSRVTAAARPVCTRATSCSRAAGASRTT